MNKCFPFFVFLAWLFPQHGMAQFSPGVDQPGCTAIKNDSSAIVSWAHSVYEFKRGAADIANGWSTLASFGDSAEALGYAQGNSLDVVSLGDSGYITLQFLFPLMNGPGNDFAVYENSFSDDYLEFAHVEVSSDGFNFVRFPSTCFIHQVPQTGPFENSVTELVHNLAGKFRQAYGTPFDLEDIADSSGIDPDSIYFVRVVDVIGSVDPAYGSHDNQGNLINDPYPTDFASGGFDLDGVAVIHENNIYAAIEDKETVEFLVYPNPSNGSFWIRTKHESFDLRIYDMAGNLILLEPSCQDGNFDLLVEPGVYLIQIALEGAVFLERLVIH